MLIASRETSAGEPILIRFGGGAAPSHPISQGQIAFKKQVEELSGGRIKAEVYHANQLGGMVQMMEMVKTGTLTMSHAGIPFCSRLAPKMELLSLPFLLAKRERALALVDGPVGTEMGEEMEKAGIRIIGWFELGFRHLTNSKREVQSPADMKGLKIRVQGNPLEMRAFQALGALPTTLDWNELYSGLQQGVVDGQENPYSLIDVAKFYETQKYLTDTGHTFDFAVVLMNKKFFEALPRDLQGVVLEAGKRATALQRQLTDEANTASAKLLEGKMRITHLTDKRREDFFNAMQPAYEYAQGKYGKEAVERLVSEARGK
jgi:tripartite ATP-independent transporter DctP family solute receptor